GSAVKVLSEANLLRVADNDLIIGDVNEFQKSKIVHHKNFLETMLAGCSSGSLEGNVSTLKDDVTQKHLSFKKEIATLIAKLDPTLGVTQFFSDYVTMLSLSYWQDKFSDISEELRLILLETISEEVKSILQTEKLEAFTRISPTGELTSVTFY
ncbi:hypothetical protein DID77_04795, partial [Candidatus Marinamargulisbacteria bacterium SCGC AG-439-L15]